MCCDAPCRCGGLREQNFVLYSCARDKSCQEITTGLKDMNFTESQAVITERMPCVASQTLHMKKNRSCVQRFFVLRYH